jgi:DNA ligase-1
MRLGVPIVPALCQRLKTANEMIEKMGTVLVEPKFDGTRVQIHYRRQATLRQAQGKTSDKRQAEWEVKTFSRTLDETSAMFPELMNLGKQIEANEVILDAEAVGVDPKTGRWLPFQDTITRKRIHNIADVSARVPLAFMVFDVVYVDGTSLLKRPLSERRAILETIIKPGKALRVTEAIETDNAEELRKFHAKQLKDGLEGAVVKQLDGIYEQGRRGFSWVKFKESESAQAKLSDTIDAVVMGFYRGKGKRAKFGIGAFLVGVADQGLERRAKSKEQKFDTNKIVTITKIGNGLTDEQFGEMRKRLEAVVSMEKPEAYVVPESLYPDVWADPSVIVEVAADEITRSPTHTAGVALRFPRLVRFRDDKDVTNMTTLAELKSIGMG